MTNVRTSIHGNAPLNMLQKNLVFPQLKKWTCWLCGWARSQNGLQLVENDNASDPTAGLASIWERLEERYGAVESVYHSVLTKLQSFPKLGARDSAKLYDLCDILGEIQALKNNPVYSTAFDSPVGVAPIVSKLPFHLQEKWANVASRYKKIQQFCISSTCIIYEFLEGACTFGSKWRNYYLSAWFLFLEFLNWFFYFPLSLIFRARIQTSFHWLVLSSYTIFHIF